MSLLFRKMAITFAIGFGVFFLAAAPSLVDAFETSDWTNLEALAVAALMGAIGAGARALIALLTAFVPTDAENGINLVGKFKETGDPPADQ